MKVIITGNMGSGKSTISKILSKKLKLERVELDEYRRKFNKKKTQEGEDRAKAEFLKKTSTKKPQIIELTGSGKTYDVLLKQFKSVPYKVILVECGNPNGLECQTEWADCDARLNFNKSQESVEENVVETEWRVEAPPSWVKAAFPEDFHQIVHENERPTTPRPSSREIIPLKKMDPDVAEILGRIIEECDLKADPDQVGTFEYDYKLIVSSLIQYRNDLESLVDAVRDCGLAVSRGEEIRKRRSWP